MRWLVAVGVVLIIGIVGATLYARQLVRERDLEVIAITAVYRGASAQQVERELSIPLERAVTKTRGLVEVRSESREGVAIVTAVVRREGRDGYAIVSEVREAMTPELSSLPREVDPPTVSRLLAPDRITHHRYVVRSTELSAMQLSRWVDDSLRRQLEVQNGVRNVERCGIVEEVVEVRPDAQRLAAVGLSLVEFTDALQRASLSLPAGRLEERGAQFLVRGGGSLRSLEDLSDVQLNENVRVRDVANVLRTGARPTCRAFERGLAVIFVDATSEGPLEKPLTLPAAPPGVTVTEVKPAGSAFFVVEGERPLVELSRAGLLLAREEGVEVLDADLSRVRQLPGVALLRRDADHVVRLSGPDLEQLDAQAELLRKKLVEALPAATVGARVRSTKPELEVTPTERSPEVVRLISLAVMGSSVAELVEGDARVDVKVVVDAPRDGDSPLERFRALRLKDGRPLDAVVKLEMREAPTAVLRVNSQRAVEVFTSAQQSEVRAALKDFALPAGVTLTLP